jgi:alpha,alpha-trehalase
MSQWSLIYEDFEPTKEKRREALCTLGNGYFATRGAAPEVDANDVHYPGTYLAGGYNRLVSRIAGRDVENEDLVNMPNWLPLTFRRVGGAWFDLQQVEVLAYRQELDLKQGVLLRNLRFKDAQGHVTRLASRCLVHMQQPHLAALETTLTAENWSGRIEIRTALDGRIINDGVARYRGLGNRHLEWLETRLLDAETLLLRVRTSQSHIEVVQAAATRLWANDQPLAGERQTREEPGYIGQLIALDIAEETPLVIEKIVSLHSSKDRATSECGLEAVESIARAGRFRDLLQSHVLAWGHLWGRFDMGLGMREPEPGLATVLVLRLHIFHLLQTVSLHTMDLDAGVPARGLHGEAYRGHVFWDELFIFPFLSLRLPEITRALLMYRYRRLDEARAAARKAGYDGAMYPWQSGSDGREETQRLHLNPKSGRWISDKSNLQRHVNAAIAYNVWQYFQVTQDMEFLSFYGAVMILEVARFWASMATYNEELERYEILGVMGPDEYHDAYPDSERPGLDNNAYTNVMAVWVLCRALEVLDLLPRERRQELSETLALRQEELERWDDVSRRMRVVFHDDGIISQFEHYERLQEFDWDGYRKKYGDIQRLDRVLDAEDDTPNRYQVSKQADVLMLFYLFSSEELGDIFGRLDYPFEYDTIPKNIDYYLKRTSHGSTLSRVTHSWVLARSDREGSWRLFAEALMSDVEDIQDGTTPEGIHLGAMASTVDMMQRAYTGIEVRGGVLWLNPRLPRTIENLCLHVHYRDKSLTLTISGDLLTVEVAGVTPELIKIGFKNDIHELRHGQTKEFTL